MPEMTAGSLHVAVVSVPADEEEDDEDMSSEKKVAESDVTATMSRSTTPSAVLANERQSSQPPKTVPVLK